MVSGGSLAEGDKELAQNMLGQDKGLDRLVAVDMHYSMVHANLDKLVAYTRGSGPVEDVDTCCLRHSKEVAEVLHRQGKDENIQVLVAQLCGCTVAELVKAMWSDDWVVLQKGKDENIHALVAP